MSNMSYCRFRNTLSDLQDCHAHLFEEVGSDEEERARKRLIELCSRIAEVAGDEEPEEDDED